jgi:hypothetical protein
VEGGDGGRHSCNGQSTAGGSGASAGCPSFAAFQPRGATGQGRQPGQGGDGGQDSRGPVVGSSCPTAVCCGLADFVVPTEFTGPSPGSAGGNGAAGMAGRGCTNALGRFVDGVWVPDTSTNGTAGAAASGGGGGGAGGGAEMEYFPNQCEFADGLGGGGGGGGAGGCGGGAGTAATSGGPAIAIYIDDASAPNVGGAWLAGGGYPMAGEAAMAARAVVAVPAARAPRAAPSRWPSA